jgi:PKD repeat protein
VNVTFGAEDELLFEFDENLSEIGDTSGFRYYDADGVDTAAQFVERTNDPRVLSVQFEPQANASTNAVGGSVDANAAIGEDTSREDGDVNQPDEVETAGEAGPGRVGDYETPPTDVDGDGLYEDVDGDGELTQADAQALYDNLDDPTVQNNVDAFDFNGDGSVTQADAQALYDEWSSSS